MQPTVFPGRTRSSLPGPWPSCRTDGSPRSSLVESCRDRPLPLLVERPAAPSPCVTAAQHTRREHPGIAPPSTKNAGMRANRGIRESALPISDTVEAGRAPVAGHGYHASNRIQNFRQAWRAAKYQRTTRRAKPFKPRAQKDIQTSLPAVRVLVAPWRGGSSSSESSRIIRSPLLTICTRKHASRGNFRSTRSKTDFFR